MKVSINTAVFLHDMEKGHSQYECMQRLDGKEIDAVQVRGEFFNGDTKNDELAQIRGYLNDHGWDFYYSVPEELFQDNDFNHDLADNIKMAEKFGIKELKYSLGRKFRAFSDQKINELKELLNNTDVKVTVENQPNEFGEIPAVKQSLQWIKDVKLNLGYTFDSGNWYWIDEDPQKAFDELHHYISTFHLKDVANRETVMLGDGKTNWKDLLERLKAGVPVFLEYDIPDNLLDHEIDLVNDTLEKM